MTLLYSNLNKLISVTIIGLFFHNIMMSQSNGWTSLTPTSTVSERSDLVMDLIDDKVILFGGKDADGDLGDTWYFDGENWTNQYPSVSPGPRHGHSSVVVDKKMYVFGGSGSGFLLNDLWEYCPANNTWKQIITNGSGPSPRKGHTAVYHSTTNTIYIMGGTTSEGGSSELFALDLTTKQWTEKADMLNFDVANHGAGILNDLLIIFGGNSFFAPFSDHFFIYDLATDTWYSIDETEGDDFSAKSDFIYTQTDNTIHVIGGKDIEGLFTDPFKERLTIELLDIDPPNLDIQLLDPNQEPIFADGFESGDACAWTDGVPKGASSGSTKILVFGGLSGEEYLNTTWLYTECETITDTLEISICEGESYEGYQEEGVYEDTFALSLGCDSIQVLNLTVLPQVNNTVVIDLCHGESYEGYSESGTYEDSFTASNGCDSIRFLELTINEKITDTIMTSLCYGESYAGYAQSGTYEDVYVANNGCDSTRILNLDIDDQILDTILTTICLGETYEGYSQSGIYEDVFSAENGCDSTRVLELDITMGIEVTDTTIVADSGSGTGSIAVLINGNNDGFTFEWSNGETTSSISDLNSGDYSVTVTDTNDCKEVFDFTVDLNTSIQLGNTNYNPEIFPNPVVDKIILKFGDSQYLREIQEIKLVDMKGGVIKVWQKEHDEIRNRELRLDNTQSGVYFLQLVIQDKIYTKKVVVL